MLLNKWIGLLEHSGGEVGRGRGGKGGMFVFWSHEVRECFRKRIVGWSLGRADRSR